mmetsp:Transcript_82593/g.229159  ORF Transcript_82593/g.229159 Transcript_82593/m.229159 type:complete len:199 (-) Transcript_82593:65-661(-)|eukprot:CAMPEP_0179052094 /NCGR_PEP_ID=MMETSP0796-20121207/21581_1 /TAXON_ID=73915 /ORGANISM="Pyrodinium bahamense, Strain pbaha01" /LENGTH=198 /DNA_ID=CAMNT_0020748651 /DNA_START=90 /DNA_END=686 /DNA_ORIENTATION=+
MSDSADVVDCSFVQAWWVEVSCLVCFLLGFAILRGKRSRGERTPGSEEAPEAVGSSNPEAGVETPGDARAFVDLMQFLQLDTKALRQPAGDASALELFRRVRQAGCRMDEALCSQLLDRGVGAELPHLVTEVARFAHAHLEMTSPLCASIMRAYLGAGMAQEARCLYDEVSARGVALEDEVDDLYDEILAKDVLDSSS